MSVFDGLDDELKPLVSDEEHRRLNPPVATVKHPYKFLPVVHEAAEEFLARRTVPPSYGSNPHDETHLFFASGIEDPYTNDAAEGLYLLANGKIVVSRGRHSRGSFSELSLFDQQYYFNYPNLDLAIVRYLNFQLNPGALGYDHENHPRLPSYTAPTNDPRFHREELRKLTRDELVRFLRKDESVLAQASIHLALSPHTLAFALKQVFGVKRRLVKKQTWLSNAKYEDQAWVLVPSITEHDDYTFEEIRPALVLTKDGELHGRISGGDPRTHLNGFPMGLVLARLWFYGSE